MSEPDRQICVLAQDRNVDLEVLATALQRSDRESWRRFADNIDNRESQTLTLLRTDCNKLGVRATVVEG